MNLNPNQYIHSPADECMKTATCQLDNNRHILKMARQLTIEGKRHEMSQALWCDEGDHAFSSRDLGRKTITLSGFDNEGNEVKEDLLVCNQHIGRFQARTTAIAGNVAEDSHTR